MDQHSLPLIVCLYPIVTTTITTMTTIILGVSIAARMIPDTSFDLLLTLPGSPSFSVVCVGWLRLYHVVR